MNENLSELLTYNEAAQFLRRKPGTLRHDVSRRRIPHVKVFGQVRFRRADLETFLSELAIPARAR
jgi:excisionase family DNA binding protein